MLFLYPKTAHHFVSFSVKSKSNHELTEQNALANRALTCLPILLCVRLWGRRGGHYGWDLLSPFYSKRLCNLTMAFPLSRLTSRHFKIQVPGRYVKMGCRQIY